MRVLAPLIMAGLCAAFLACEDGDDDDSAPLEDLAVSDNEACTLTAWARWTTAEPATSRVEFGEDGELQFFVEDDALVTDHELLVFGMRPQTTYTLRAVSRAEDGSEIDAGEAEYTTGSLPFEGLTTEVDVHEPDLVQPGWTLTNILVDTMNQQVWAVAFDMEGQVVWYHVHGDELARADIEVTLVDGRNVLIGGSMAGGTSPVEVDLAGNVIWEGPVMPPDDTPTPPGAYHHSFKKLDNGNYQGLRYALDGNVYYDEVVELGPDGADVWTWEARDLPVEDPDFYPWGNAALIFDDVVYYSSRGHSAQYKVDRATGDLLWALGEGGDFAPDPDHLRPWFHEAHAPEIQDDGTLMLYDNGLSSTNQSRVIRYEIDDVAMTSRIVWEYPGDDIEDPWYSFHMGDADRQPNGNTLIHVPHLLEGGSENRIMEITEDRLKVWQLWLLGEGGTKAGGFAADRIPVLVGVL